MLRRLTIHNYALIDSLDVEFAAGFSVITGETGAGKSIILGALQLLLGARSDARAIKDPSRQCRVEAEFDDNILTRVLSPNGKSRAFIDDEPVALAQLKETADRLIDIHSQHQNLLLQTSNFQLSVIDTLAVNGREREEYLHTFKDYCSTRDELKRLTEMAESQERERDFIQFQLEQLLDAAICDGEEIELEEEVRTLSHASETSDLLTKAASALCDDEHGILQTLHAASQYTDSAASLNPKLCDLAERVKSTYIEMKDLASEVSDASEDITIDPERLQIAEQRLDTINTLLHKHHVGNTRELIALQNELDTRLADMEGIDSRIEKTKKRLEEQEKSMTKCAANLSASRRAICPEITKKLHETLAQLGMPNARVQINISARQAPSVDGVDEVAFMMATNQGSAFNTLSSLSGGEAARVMLAIKSMLTGAVKLPTIVFDEIDTGVSGRIAEAMGQIMRDMGDCERQVISITHLPQIAAKGTTHYQVFKTDTDDQTQTHIHRLTDEERVHEIATMLSGEDMTDAAIQNAKALLRL